MPLSRGAPGSLRMGGARGGWRGDSEAASCFREVCLIGIGNAADLPSSRTLKGKYLPRHILGGVGDQIADKTDNVFNLGITAENRRKGFPPLPQGRNRCQEALHLSLGRRQQRSVQRNA